MDRCGGSPRTIAGRVALSVAVLLVLGPFAALNAFAATRSGGPGFQPRPPALLQPLSLPRMSLTAAAPGSREHADNVFRFEGDGAGRTTLGADVSGSGLAPALHVTVIRGTGVGPGFQPASFDRGSGPGVVFDGTLAELARGTGAIADPLPWVPGEVGTYRVVVVFSGTDAFQGRTAVAAFTWQIQSLG